MEDIQDEVATLASHLHAGTCRWLELVGELDRRGDWAEFGSGSCADWLAWRCGLLPRAAREHVRVARCLAGLPLIHAAFAVGRLSYSKVRALTRVADADSEQELLDLARTLTAAELERALRAYRRVTTCEANELHDGAYVTTDWQPDGTLTIRGCLTPEDGALLLAALEAFRGPLWKAGSAEPPQRPTAAEALVAIADRALTTAEGAGDRYQVVVHVDHDTLVDDDPDGGCALDDGPALASETVRRLACDASVVTMSERGGKPVTVGRKTRAVPSALRRALRARDRGCRFPGCENHRFVDAHHIDHWARGGPTNLDNLVLLCRRHHRLLHEGGYAIDHRRRFFDPWGFEVPAVPQPPAGDPSKIPRPCDAPAPLRTVPARSRAQPARS